jgi:hypothetical protein
LAGQAGSFAGRKGGAHIRGALLSAEPGLCRGRFDTFDQPGVHWQFNFGGKTPGEPLGLVELAFAFFDMMQGNGNDQVPFFRRQRWNCFPDEGICKKSLKPQAATVFEAMDYVQDQVIGDYRRAGESKGECLILAIGAIESSADFAFKRQSAAFAKGRGQPAHFAPARGADIAFRRASPLVAANLADGWIDEVQRGIEPRFQQRTNVFVGCFQ